MIHCDTHYNVAYQRDKPASLSAPTSPLSSVPCPAPPFHLPWLRYPRCDLLAVIVQVPSHQSFYVSSSPNSRDQVSASEHRRWEKSSAQRIADQKSNLHTQFRSLHPPDSLALAHRAAGYHSASPVQLPCSLGASSAKIDLKATFVLTTSVVQASRPAPRLFNQNGPRRRKEDPTGAASVNSFSTTPTILSSLLRRMSGGRKQSHPEWAFIKRTPVALLIDVLGLVFSP